MRNLKLIILREYLARVRHKTFVIMTFVSPIVIVAMIALVAYLASLNEEEENKIAVKDEIGVFQEYLGTEGNTSFLNYNRFSVDAALDSVKAQDLDGLLFIPDKNLAELNDKVQFYANNSPSKSLISKIENRLSNRITERRLTNANVNLETIKANKTEVNIITENLSGEKTSSLAKYVKMFFGGAAGYLIMMFIIIYGNMIMRSVIEEKTNRIVEIIISSVKPIHLMLGKITGNTLAGITQFLIWAILGGILLIATSFIFDISLGSPAATGSAEIKTSEIQAILADILRLPLGELVFAFVVYFIGGYLLYSGIYAAIGGAVDSEADTQQFIFPVIIPLMLGIYVGFFSVIENPHGTIAVLFSHIPLTSPVVMLMRIPFGVPWWEVVISISILIATMFCTIWLGAKIYRVGILMHGNKPSYKELYRWMKRGN
jgi:ABC-2 type transport system permease protein